MITIYGRTDSGNCYKPRLLLAKLGIPFRHVEIRLGPTAARARRPSSPRTPTARCRCWSSTTAACSPNPTPSCSISPKARASFRRIATSAALAYQWLFFEQYSHEPYIAVRRALLIYPEPRQGRDAGAARRDAGSAATRRCGVMEKQLRRTPFFAGKRMSVADIALYAYTHERARAASTSRPIRRSAPGSAASRPTPATCR